MDKLDLMRVFVTVCEVESFTRAAETLNMPKASISLYIQKLESLLGARLLHRTTRKVTITQDGSAFLERCKDLLADMDEVESMFSFDGSKLVGRIRVDMPTSLARNLVIKKLPEFLALYPEIEVELGSTDRKVDLVREGYDCVVRAGKLSDSGLVAKKISEYKIVNCVSSSYAQKNGVPRKIEDLSKHRQIHYVSTFGSKPEGFDYFDGERYVTVKMQGSVTVNNAEAYLAACLAGLGIIQVPYVGVKEHLENGSLIEVLPKLKSEPMPVSIVYSHRRNLPQRVRVFMDWMQEIMEEYTA